jgi:hypothetical protein
VDHNSCRTRAYGAASRPRSLDKEDSVKTNLVCPCGEHIQGQDEDDLVEKVLQHLRDKHPDLAEVYGREHILFMAY